MSQVTLEVDRTHRERWTSPGIYNLLSASQVFITFHLSVSSIVLYTCGQYSPLASVPLVSSCSHQVMSTPKVASIVHCPGTYPQSKYPILSSFQYPGLSLFSRQLVLSSNQVPSTVRYPDIKDGPLSR
jgi:hypothetical protein